MKREQKREVRNDSGGPRPDMNCLDVVVHGQLHQGVSNGFCNLVNYSLFRESAPLKCNNKANYFNLVALCCTGTTGQTVQLVMF